jgi:16S rRNA (adenine1518-N6/adenine1519-N6)-dimethyltransferase
MTRNEVRQLGCDEQLFKRIVKTVFNQRRKMLRVSLKQLLPAEALSVLSDVLSGESSQLSLTLRPEQLTIPQFVVLTNEVEKLLCANTND